ncbi:putative HAD superfamily hydrolase [Hypoxylon sp. FL1284]|nr:putative HAD superfamily hydrolase [Hypoxylon sp. FL1284]
MRAFRPRAVLGRTAASDCILRPHSLPIPSSSARAASHLRRRGFIQSQSPICASGFPRSLSIDRKAPRPPPFAFAFDIDGVLLHVAKPIPGATQTLEYLQKHNIPFILLTNGGGKHETDRVTDLSSRLGVPLSTDNFVQSHTPFQELVDGGPDGEEGLRDKNVLVTGSDAAKCRAIAERYGFRHVIIPADILAAHPTVWPFEPLLAEVYAAQARPLPEPQPKIDAVLVFNDPRDWALDIQLITDLLQSRGGVLGTYSPLNGRADLDNAGWQRDGQPKLYFSNPDLLWSAAYHLPRFGQGAFQAALAGVWDQVTGGAAPLRRTVIGKPHARTYAYAERVLDAHRRAVVLGPGDGNNKQENLEPLRTVYMVGDNPASDIRGANGYRSANGATSWDSVLVRTGVWDPERGGKPAHEPTAVADDVRHAVRWALEREGWDGGGLEG